MNTFSTPILFLIFNRPDVTKCVFEEIRKQKPQYLYLAADGPRANKPGEYEKCILAREVVLEGIDWNCELKTLYRDENLGCGKAVSEAITWFFEHVEEGIILEDDCLPNNSFFTFCSELLDRFRTTDKIMHISGNNFQDEIWRGEGSYYFSQFPHIWGWATWKRAWILYDHSLRNFPDFEKNKTIIKTVKDKNQAKFWLNIFHSGFTKSVDTWDYAWFFTFFSNNGYAILPNRNLVSNIGFGVDATHTNHKDSQIENLPVFKLDNIVHPKFKLNKEADSYTYYKLFHNYQSVGDRIGRKMKSIIKNQDLRKKINFIKKIVKQLISVTGYSLHIQKVRTDNRKILQYKTGRYTLNYPLDHQLINTLIHFPDYSQNICRISKIVKNKYSDLHIIDVGANIGDTVIFIRNEVNCPILSIEGDNEYYQFLKSNTENIDDVLICRTFLDEQDHIGQVYINKSSGSLNLSVEKEGEVTDFVKLDTLLEKFPDFKKSKILKIDTDGYDIKILKGSDELIRKARPVIFFEYDVNFYASSGILTDFIKSLEKTGYNQIVIYDNFGRFLMKLKINDHSILHYLTLYVRNNKTIYYYDFCVFHEEDSDICSKLCEIETNYKYHYQ